MWIPFVNHISNDGWKHNPEDACRDIQGVTHKDQAESHQQAVEDDMAEYNGDKAVTQHDQTEQQTDDHELYWTCNDRVDWIKCMSKCPDQRWNQTGDEGIAHDFCIMRMPNSRYTVSSPMPAIQAMIGKIHA